MADKAEATFHPEGWNSQVMQDLYHKLHVAFVKERRRVRRRAVLRNLLTTCTITGVFVGCLDALGPWGYLIAIPAVSAYFTWKDLRRLREFKR